MKTSSMNYEFGLLLVENSQNKPQTLRASLHRDHMNVSDFTSMSRPAVLLMQLHLHTLFYHSMLQLHGGANDAPPCPRLSTSLC